MAQRSWLKGTALLGNLQASGWGGMRTDTPGDVLLTDDVEMRTGHPAGPARLTWLARAEGVRGLTEPPCAMNGFPDARHSSEDFRT